mmetsp:Transcript_16657/g.30563  ORF Transcript_16657/g.30563 Transcript_16657/m.30563 type:complete len:416 (+) Transcript_16657:290-1537(+)
MQSTFESTSSKESFLDMAARGMSAQQRRAGRTEPVYTVRHEKYNKVNLYKDKARHGLVAQLSDFWNGITSDRLPESCTRPQITPRCLRRNNQEKDLHVPYGSGSRLSFDHEMTVHKTPIKTSERSEPRTPLRRQRSSSDPFREKRSTHLAHHGFETADEVTPRRQRSKSDAEDSKHSSFVMNILNPRFLLRNSIRSLSSHTDAKHEAHHAPRHDHQEGNGHHELHGLPRRHQRHGRDQVSGHGHRHRHHHHHHHRHRHHTPNHDIGQSEYESARNHEHTQAHAVQHRRHRRKLKKGNSSSSVGINETSASQMLQPSVPQDSYNDGRSEQSSSSRTSSNNKSSSSRASPENRSHGSRSSHGSRRTHGSRETHGSHGSRGLYDNPHRHYGRRGRRAHAREAFSFYNAHQRGETDSDA